MVSACKEDLKFFRQWRKKAIALSEAYQKALKRELDLSPHSIAAHQLQMLHIAGWDLVKRKEKVKHGLDSTRKTD